MRDEIGRVASDALERVGHDVNTWMQQQPSQCDHSLRCSFATLIRVDFLAAAQRGILQVLGQSELLQTGLDKLRVVGSQPSVSRRSE